MKAALGVRKGANSGNEERVCCGHIYKRSAENHTLGGH